MRRDYNPSLRQDTRQLARATGSSGGWFWGVLAGVVFVFWPAIFHAKPGVAAFWYILLGTGVLFLVLGSMDGERKQQLPPPPPPLPDLRASDEFSGEWTSGIER